MTTLYLQETAAQAGLETVSIAMEDIGLDGLTGRFVDLQHRYIRSVFKLYPWEWLAEDEFGARLLSTVDLGGSTGSTLWSYDLPPGFDFRWAAAAYDAGTVFLADGDGGLHAIDAATGVRRWHAQADYRHPWAPPTAADGSVFLNAGGGVWPQTNSMLTAFLLGLLLVCYTITGFDASAHTSEETRDAARIVPRGMMQSVFWSGLFG